jgi:hypothetical protein
MRKNRATHIVASHLVLNQEQESFSPSLNFSCLHCGSLECRAGASRKPQESLAVAAMQGCFLRWLAVGELRTISGKGGSHA